MKVLIVDTDGVGLPFALRCRDAGHTPLLWQPKGDIGKGLVERPKEWKTLMGKADLIFVTDNSKVTGEMEKYFKAGYPIFGPNVAGAALELDREVGQRCFEEHGIETAPYKTFKNYDEAIAYVRREKRTFVSKPWGGNPDKDLSYVPKSPEDLICRLERWKKLGVKGEFLLQEMIDSASEMAVGGWFGPGGWSEWLCENWEEKRMLAGGLGPNTGEMGTVLRYVKKSKLAEEVLFPVTETLERIRYVGYVDVNCLIDEEGIPWPLEFTCRPGWPLFNIQMALHKGDPAKWMLDTLKGKWTLDCQEDIAVGVVMATGDFPWDNQDHALVDDWPIRGLSKRNRKHLEFSSVKVGEAPGGRPPYKTEEALVTAGSYVLIATGLGKTVCDARSSVYEICDEIHLPIHWTYRTDIGCRLEGDLESLHKLGYAKGLEYE